jgi:hypothetical protein
MKVKSLSEVKELIASPGFLAWWQELSAARGAEASALERLDEIMTQSTLMDFRADLAQKNAIDTLYRAGGCEDSASKLLADATALENRSFEVVATFEEHRFKVSELWYRLGAAEKGLEEIRERVQRFKELIEAAGADRAKRREAEAELSGAGVEQRKAEREHRQIHEDYEREAQRKMKLWDEVERMWASSAELNLLVSEKRAEGKKIRRRAERLFREAEDCKQKGRALRAEAEQQSHEAAQRAARSAELMRAARELFGCAVGGEFLYWRPREDQSGALCLSLIADSDAYNIEIKPLGIYRVEKQRGVEFLEPAQEAPRHEEEDGRFEEYFLKGRKGRIREVAAETTGT